MKKLFAFGYLLFGTISVYAQPTPPPISNAGILPGPKSADNGAGIDFVKDTLGPSLTNGFLWITLAIATAMFVVSGVMYIMSRGDEEMVKKAKDTIMWTVIGTVAAILSLAIVKLLVGLNFEG